MPHLPVPDMQTNRVVIDKLGHHSYDHCQKRHPWITLSAELTQYFALFPVEYPENDRENQQCEYCGCN